MRSPRKNKKKTVIGVDEVGRGALAGPLYVAAVALPGGYRFPHALGKLSDSKKMSASRRLSWERYLRSDPRLCVAVASVAAGKVDEKNVSRAANDAAGCALRALFRKGGAALRSSVIVCDGGLFPPQKREILRREGRRIEYVVRVSRMRFRAETVPKADETVPAVALASIAAKVRRDAYMERLSVRHPAYGFAAHKGYGTASHRAALKRHGPSGAHRKTFLRRILRGAPHFMENAEKGNAGQNVPPAAF